MSALNAIQPTTRDLYIVHGNFIEDPNKSALASWSELRVAAANLDEAIDLAVAHWNRPDDNGEAGDLDREVVLKVDFLGQVVIGVL